MLPSFERKNPHTFREGNQLFWSLPAVGDGVLPGKLACALCSSCPQTFFLMGTAVGSCSHLPGTGKQMALGFWDSSNFKCSLVVRQMYCFLVQELSSTLCMAINPVSSYRFCPRKVWPLGRQDGHFQRPAKDWDWGLNRPWNGHL